VGAGFEVDPASLRRAAQGVRDAAQRLAEVWRAADEQGRGMGDIFGDDAVGGLIGASYRAANGIADGSYGSVARGFGEFADGLVAMADRYEGSDRTAVAAFSRVGS
jgi:hypothetical protein